MAKSKPKTRARAREPAEDAKGGRVIRSPRRKVEAGVETRIDSAHVVPDPQELPGVATAPVVELPPRIVCPEEVEESPAPTEQLQAQADQLAAHLRSRQCDLDRRETQLNARLAQWDSDTRTARLWLGERQAELQERLAALAEEENASRGRVDRLAVVETTLATKQQELDVDLAKREESLTQREAQLDARAERVAAQEAAIEGLRQREQRIEAEEARLAALAQQTELLHRQLTEDQRRFEERRGDQAERLVEERTRMLRALEDEREALRRRSEQTDQSHASLEQVRSELSRMHRETLQVRLATEELWAELAGAAPPAAITRSLGQIRTRLAEEYRLAETELKAKRDELLEIRQRLAQQHEAILKQKRELDGWAAGRRSELDHQAARLVGREQELDAQEAESRRQSRQWQAERLECQRQIRRLEEALRGRTEAEESRVESRGSRARTAECSAL